MSAASDSHEPRKHLIYTPALGRHSRSSATVVVRHRKLDPCDVIAVDGLNVTARPLTVLDAAADLGIAVIDSALLTGVVTLPELVAAYRRYPRRRGIGAVARFLALLESGARSEAERVVVALFRKARITGWVANHPVGG